jgi:hypothetical protein
MDRNLASILALASTAAVSVTLAAIAPGDAYADDSAGGIQAKYNQLPATRSDASIEDLKRLYLECDRASMVQVLTSGDAMMCSTVYEALKRHAFDGDFDRLLMWSRANASPRFDEP